MEELEPRLRELVGEFFGMVEPTAGDLPVDRVETHRQVGGEHRRVGLPVALGHWHRIGPAAVLRSPLIGARGTLEEFPLIAVQDLEEAVVPLGRCVSPRHFEAAGDRVVANAGALGILPTKTHLFER